MKKIVLILSASFSSISAFANEDLASNESYGNNFAANAVTNTESVNNDEIIAQTFADGANKEIAALSTEEMQNTKGASFITSMAVGLTATTTTGAAVEAIKNHIQHKIRTGSFASSDSTYYALATGAKKGFVSGVVSVPAGMGVGAGVTNLVGGSGAVSAGTAAKIGGVAQAATGVTTNLAVRKHGPDELFPDTMENPYNDYSYNNLSQDYKDIINSVPINYHQQNLIELNKIDMAAFHP